MRVFVSGPLTTSGAIEANKRNAALMGLALYRMGHTPVIPHTMYGHEAMSVLEHKDFMAMCYGLIDGCEAVVMLPGWQSSDGATLEHDYAVAQGVRVVFDVIDLEVV